MNKEEKYEIGDRLRSIREELELNQREFAETLESAPSYLSEIESDKKKPGHRLLILLYEKYNVNLSWLLTGHGERYCISEEGRKEGDSIIKSKDGIKEGLREYFGFGDQTDRVYQMLDYMSRSPLFMSVMMTNYLSSYYKNEDLLKKDLNSNKTSKSKKES